MILTAISILCVMVLIGLYAYSGSFLPNTVQSEGGRATVTWILWGVVAGIPSLTLVLLIGRWFKRHDDGAGQ